MNYWWVVAKENKNDLDHSWHWKAYFENSDEDGGKFEWGGPDWIKSSYSHNRIQDMHPGDVVITYQANEGILGLTHLASKGYQYQRGGNYDSFDLVASPYIRLDKAIPFKMIRNLPDAGEHIEFVKFQQNSVFRVTSHGFDMILKTILQMNPTQETNINKFLLAGKKRIAPAGTKK